jgi:hypothetical protein
MKLCLSVGDRNMAMAYLHPQTGPDFLILFILPNKFVYRSMLCNFKCTMRHPIWVWLGLYIPGLVISYNILIVRLLLDSNLIVLELV